MNKKLKVGVLMGGPSAEYEVSLATGQNVIDNLSRSKYQPVAIKISKEKEWFVGGKKMTETKALAGHDIIFNALHGTFGEDGRVQALLEYYDKPCTGSGITASALAMDKLRSREIFRLAGLQVPKTLKIRRGDNYQALLNVFVNKVVNFPVVVKPCSNGSSVGVLIVNNQNNLDKAVKAAFQLDKKVLIEEFIEGREITCGVLDPVPALEKDESLIVADRQIFFKGGALPVTEILPKRSNKFYNYKAKYKDGQCDFVTPAQMNDDLKKRIQEIAVKTHQLLGCKAYSRTDMIIESNDIYVLEINTLPGLTPHSLVPMAAQAAGLNLSQLLDNIITSSLA